MFRLLRPRAWVTPLVHSPRRAVTTTALSPSSSQGKGTVSAVANDLFHDVERGSGNVRALRRFSESCVGAAGAVLVSWRADCRDPKALFDLVRLLRAAAKAMAASSEAVHDEWALADCHRCADLVIGAGQLLRDSVTSLRGGHLCHGIIALHHLRTAVRLRASRFEATDPRRSILGSLAEGAAQWTGLAPALEQQLFAKLHMASPATVADAPVQIVLKVIPFLSSKAQAHALLEAACAALQTFAPTSTDIEEVLRILRELRVLHGTVRSGGVAADHDAVLLLDRCGCRLVDRASELFCERDRATIAVKARTSRAEQLLAIAQMTVYFVHKGPCPDAIVAAMARFRDANDDFLERNMKIAKTCFSALAISRFKGSDALALVDLLSVSGRLLKAASTSDTMTIVMECFSFLDASDSLPDDVAAVVNRVTQAPVVDYGAFEAGRLVLAIFHHYSLDPSGVAPLEAMPSSLLQACDALVVKVGEAATVATDTLPQIFRIVGECVLQRVKATWLRREASPLPQSLLRVLVRMLKVLTTQAADRCSVISFLMHLEIAGGAAYHGEWHGSCERPLLPTSAIGLYAPDVKRLFAQMCEQMTFDDVPTVALRLPLSIAEVAVEPDAPAFMVMFNERASSLIPLSDVVF